MSDITQGGTYEQSILKRQREVPAFDYLRGLKSQRSEILEAIARVLDSGTLILGPEVTAFENEFAQFVGSKNAIGMSSGTDALIVALRVLNIGRGHEVITVANGPVPTIAAIRAVGATPRFVDIDANCLQMDPRLCQRAQVTLPRHEDTTFLIAPAHRLQYPVA